MELGDDVALPEQFSALPAAFPKADEMHRCRLQDGNKLTVRYDGMSHEEVASMYEGWLREAGLSELEAGTFYSNEEGIKVSFWPLNNPGSDNGGVTLMVLRTKGPVLDTQAYAAEAARAREALKAHWPALRAAMVLSRPDQPRCPEALGASTLPGGVFWRQDLEGVLGVGGGRLLRSGQHVGWCAPIAEGVDANGANTGCLDAIGESRFWLLGERVTVPPRARPTGTFEAGYEQGVFVVYDTTTRAPVCRKGYRVMSSESLVVQVDESASAASREASLKGAVEADIAVKVREVRASALRELSPRLAEGIPYYAGQ